MKKHLLTNNSSSGYTLIELLVVITIMAILAIIGFSLYVNAQKNARDGIRRTELGSLARSIESTKNPTGNTYTYNSTNYSADYPQNTPKDPLKLVSAPYYCIATGDGSADIPDPAAAGWTGAINCPPDVAGSGYTAWSTLVNEAGSYSGGALATGVRRWKICARLESSGTPYCVKSNQ